MKKQLLLLLSIFLLVGASFSAKAQAFEQGNSVVTLGYGFPNLMKLVFKTYETNAGYSTIGIGPIHLKYEYALGDQFGVGVSIGFTNYKVEWTDNAIDGSNKVYAAGYKGGSFGVLARFNYHFATGDKVDPYVGVGAGYTSYNFKYFNDDPDYIASSFDDFSFPIPIGFEGTVGVRYYFTDNIGAYAEIGYGRSLVQAGLAAKF